MTLFVERSTRLLYEAKLFPTFVIVRPATPGFEGHLQRMEHNTFLDDFEEFAGIHEEVRDFLSGTLQLPVVN